MILTTSDCWNPENSIYTGRSEGRLPEYSTSRERQRKEFADEERAEEDDDPEQVGLTGF
jgi:hypothetical protein